MDALEFHGFEVDGAERQLEPHDQVTASYLVTNRSAAVVLKNIEITHEDRRNLAGDVVVSFEPSRVTIEGPLGPNDERQVTVELSTAGELPGTHVLRAEATYECHPVRQPVEGLLEFTVAPD